MAKIQDQYLKKQTKVIFSISITVRQELIISKINRIQAVSLKSIKYSKTNKMET